MTLHLKSAKLARWQLHLVCWSGALLWLSGAVWLVLHNFLRVEGEFGPEINPLEPWMLRLHGAAMIGALLGIGSLLVVHVWRGWGYRSQRWIGVALISLAAFLTVTGYLLYYVGDDEWRGWISVAHWAGGIIALAAFLVHYRSGTRIGRG